MTDAKPRLRGEPGAVGCDLRRLSPRQWQCLRLAAAGFNNREIGERLYIEAGTARNYRSEAYRRIGIGVLGDRDRYTKVALASLMVGMTEAGLSPEQIERKLAELGVAER